jgi:hypothetical protein
VPARKLDLSILGGDICKLASFIWRLSIDCLPFG